MYPMIVSKQLFRRGVCVELWHAWGGTKICGCVSKSRMMLKAAGGDVASGTGERVVQWSR